MSATVILFLPVLVVGAVPTPSYISLALFSDFLSFCIFVSQHVTSGAMKFVDVRRSDEFEVGHCKDSVNIVWDGDACWDGGITDKVCKQFIDDMTTFVDGNYQTPIFVHCVSGNRASQVAMFLQVRLRVDARVLLRQENRPVLRACEVIQSCVILHRVLTGKERKTPT